MSNLHPLIQKWKETRTKEKRGLYLYGSTGVGKTYNLKILAEKKGHKFYTAPKFLNEIAQLRMQSSMDKMVYTENQNRISWMLSGERAVILDDLGAEKLSERKLEDLYTLVDNLYENGKTLLISSNLSLAELEQKVGDRVCSRINGMCHVVELSGEDKRF